MNANPLVSVIINNYNYSRFVRDAINSTIAQNYKNVEVLIVDDGSTDNSLEIISQYSDKAKILAKENGGQISALNIGFQESKGDIVIFLDADDLLLSEAVSSIVEKFDSPDVAKVHWPLLRISETGERSNEIIPVCPLPDGNLKSKLIKYGPTYFDGKVYGNPPTSGNAFSRKFLQTVFPLVESECSNGGGDLQLSLLAIAYGKIQKLNEPLTLYRVHGTNYTLKPLEEYAAAFFCCFEYICVVLERYFYNQGIVVKTKTWPRDSWHHKIDISLCEITSLVPPDSSFILVDGNQWMTNDSVRGRKRILFVDADGTYWGPPENDELGIAEIAKRRIQGAHSIFFAWPAFWYLEHYTQMRDYLEHNFACIIKNERLVGYAL